MDNNNILKGILAGVVALVVMGLIGTFSGGSIGVGTPDIADYDPFIKTYGINTAKDVTLSGTNTFSGATTISGAATLTSTFKLGSSGTTQDNQVITTCSMKADNSIAATSTGYAYCTGVTGVTSSDYVTASFATSTLGFPAVSENIVILSAKASTTAGAIDFNLLNLSGGTVVPSAAGRLGSTTVIRASN